MPKPSKPPNVPQTEEKTITVAEAARRLRRAPSNIRRNLELGRLYGRRVLGRWEVFESHVHEILSGDNRQTAALDKYSAPKKTRRKTSVGPSSSPPGERDSSPLAASPHH